MAGVRTRVRRFGVVLAAAVVSSASAAAPAAAVRDCPQAQSPRVIAAGLDGMTIDAAGRVYVTADAAGELWRVGTDRSICALARGRRQPSAVALRDGSAIVVGFDGRILELPGALPAG
ncbi:MAG: hypothetical protein WD844_13825 [Thermoleophilaceae bacterium]